MSAPGGRAVARQNHAAAAKELIESWVSTLSHPLPDPVDLLRLRGMATGALADMDAEAYDEGVVRGRRDVAHTVRDALDGEGL